MIRQQRGYTLVEWMVVVVIGLFLTAGIAGFLVASQRTTSATAQLGEMQESGRLAMYLISRDLKAVGLWGDFTGNPMVVGSGVTIASSASVSTDCTITSSGGTSEGSLPTSSGHFYNLWAANVPTSATMSSSYTCINPSSSSESLVVDSTVIGIKRLIGSPLDDSATSVPSDTRYYFAANTSEARIFDKDSGFPGDSDIPNRRIWEYQHHVYYLEESGGVPYLRLLWLLKGDIKKDAPLVEGIEQMRLLFGVDNDGDSEIDKFVSADNVADADWRLNRVLAAKLYLLVRALSEDPAFENNNSYQLGDISVSGGGDHYRRLLLQGAVSLRNLVYGGAG